MLLAGAVAAESLPSTPPVAAPPVVPALACPARQARIRLSVVDPEPRHSTELGIEALHAATGEARSPMQHHLALTTSRVEWRSELGARTTIGRGEAPQVCAVPDRVTLTLVQSEHLVRIAREIAPESCLFREVAAHEARHVAVNRRTLRTAAIQARGGAQAWASGAEGRGKTEAEAMAAMQHSLRRAIEPSLAAMRANRDAAHRAIDTPAEYRRLGQVCRADQQALRTKLQALSAD